MLILQIPFLQQWLSHCQSHWVRLHQLYGSKQPNNREYCYCQQIRKCILQWNLLREYNCLYCLYICRFDHLLHYFESKFHRQWWQIVLNIRVFEWWDSTVTEHYLLTRQECDFQGEEQQKLCCDGRQKYHVETDQCCFHQLKLLHLDSMLHRDRYLVDWTIQIKYKL